MPQSCPVLRPESFHNLPLQGAREGLDHLALWSWRSGGYSSLRVVLWKRETDLNLWRSKHTDPFGKKCKHMLKGTRGFLGRGQTEPRIIKELVFNFKYTDSGSGPTWVYSLASCAVLNQPPCISLIPWIYLNLHPAVLLAYTHIPNLSWLS